MPLGYPRNAGEGGQGDPVSLRVACRACCWVACTSLGYPRNAGEGGQGDSVSLRVAGFVEPAVLGESCLGPELSHSSED